MGRRMFVALQPPDDIAEDLEAFLSSRPGMPWIDREQWHITLAFMESVPAQREDELAERLASSYKRKEPATLRLRGAGCFPYPAKAKVLWLRPVVLSGDLEALAGAARRAASKSGAAPDGRRFTGHLSIARLRRPIDATKWLQILDTFESREWDVNQVELIASYLREGPAGRPRYESVSTFPLGDTQP